MTKVIARVHPVHLMNVDWAPGGRQPPDQATVCGVKDLARYSNKTELVDLRKCSPPLSYKRCIFKRYHSNKYFSEFYSQDGGKNQLALIWNKTRSLSPMYMLGAGIKMWKGLHTYYITHQGWGGVEILYCVIMEEGVPESVYTHFVCEST